MQKVFIVLLLISFIMLADVHAEEKEHEDVSLSQVEQMLNAPKRPGEVSKFQPDVPEQVRNCKKTKSCSSCTYVAYHYLWQTKLEDATTFATIACDEKCADGCAILGKIHSKRDEKDLALSRHRDACVYGNVESCYVLATEMEVQGIEQGAASLYKKACGHNHIASCLKLAAKHMKDKEFGSAKKLYRRACKFDSFFACAELGKLDLAMGNTERARKFLNRACDAGENDACSFLIQATKDGTL